MIDFKNNKNFFLIAGPCAIEQEEMSIQIARKVKAICEKLNIPYIFKGSYRKANRSRLDSFTGIGDEKALNILKRIKEELQIPVTTDIHSAAEAELAAKFVDVIQIPAFLCRQTDILVAAAKTGKFVNIKKGQFAGAQTMRFALDKVLQINENQQVMLTERGNSFGYNDLVVDFNNITKMKKLNASIVLDCTHSLQKPNLESGVTGGDPELIETIAKAGIAVGADGLFIETHPEPKAAKSDGANMLPLNKLEPLLNQLVKIKAATN